MNEVTSLSIDLFKANSEINRLYLEIQKLTVENVKSAQTIEGLQNKLKLYTDKYGDIND